MWAAADDCWSANYIETLMECLLARPEAALAAGRTLYIDGKGNRRTSDPDDAPARHPVTESARPSSYSNSMPRDGCMASTGVTRC